MVAASSAADLALEHPEQCAPHEDTVAEEVLHLFDLMRSRLLRYAAGFGISIEEGEDVVQEVFLALFHHLQRGRSRDNLHGWLFQVTHNLALKSRIRTLRETTDLDREVHEQPAPEPGPEDWLLTGERTARLQSVLHALPLEDQLCLRLRAEGLRYREISRVVGISLGSVSASLHRSLARLQEVDRR